jgi:hypothetical protein
VPLDALACTDRLGGFERPASGKHRQTVEQTPFRAGQQMITPIERRMQRLLARQGHATAARQEADTLVEPRRDLLHREALDPSCRELQGEGNAVQTLTHLSDHRRVTPGECEPRLHGRGPFEKQPEGWVLLELGEWRQLPQGLVLAAKARARRSHQ